MKSRRLIHRKSKHRHCKLTHCRSKYYKSKHTRHCRSKHKSKYYKKGGGCWGTSSILPTNEEKEAEHIEYCKTFTNDKSCKKNVQNNVTNNSENNIPEIPEWAKD